MAQAPAVLADTIDAKVLLSVLAKVRVGDFSARMPLEWTGVAGKVADGLDDVWRAVPRRWYERRSLQARRQGCAAGRRDPVRGAGRAHERATAAESA